MVITLRVQKIVKDKIDKAAKIKGINSATLSRMWLVERLTRKKVCYTSASLIKSFEKIGWDL